MKQMISQALEEGFGLLPKPCWAFIPIFNSLTINIKYDKVADNIFGGTQMKKQISRKTALILLIIFTLMAACTQQNENNTTAEAVDGEPLLPATINGEITFQANTSDSTLYVVNVDDPTLSYKLDVPGSMNEANPMKPASYSIEVAPGNYYLFTYTTNGVMAAAYAGAADGSLYVLTLNPGETANEINLRLVYPQYPCQFTQLPASPDGVYPAVETNTTCIEEYNAFETKTAAESGSSGDPTETAPAVISGTIGYQGPPTPTSILYIVNPYTGNWYWTEILGSANTISFSYTVEPGTYILYAHQSDGAGSQAAAFMNTDGTVAEMVLRSGQILDGVTMTFAYPTSPCQRTAIPASPDGRYSAIAKTC